MTQIFRGEQCAEDGKAYVGTVTSRNGTESPEEEEQRLEKWIKESMARRREQKRTEDGDVPSPRTLREKE